MIVVCHPRIPLLECRPQRAVEGLGSGLQKEMSASLAPLHLLLFSEALTDDGVDGSLDEGGGYLPGLAMRRIADSHAGKPKPMPVMRQSSPRRHVPSLTRYAH